MDCQNELYWLRHTNSCKVFTHRLYYLIPRILRNVRLLNPVVLKVKGVY